MGIKGFKVNDTAYKLDYEAIEDTNLGVCIFAAGSSVQAGDFVTMSANNTVRTCNLGDGIVGRVLSLNEGYAEVLVRGRVEAGYLGSLSLGWHDITSQGTKLVSAGANDDPRNALIISIDTDAKTVVALLW